MQTTMSSAFVSAIDWYRSLQILQYKKCDIGRLRVMEHLNDFHYENKAITVFCVFTDIVVHHRLVYIIQHMNLNIQQTLQSNTTNLNVPRIVFEKKRYSTFIITNGSVIMASLIRMSHANSAFWILTSSIADQKFE